MAVLKVYDAVSGQWRVTGGATTSTVKGGLTPVSISSSGTLEVNTAVYADTAAGAFVAAMPIDPIQGDRMQIIDAGNCFPANNLVLDRNGSKFGGLSEDLTIDLSNVVDLYYVDTDYGWRVTVSGTLVAAANAVVNGVSPHFFQPKNNYFYSLPAIVGPPSTAVAIIANQMAVVPFVIGRDSVLRGVGIEVTAPGTGLARLGVYPSNANCLDAKATNILDAGEISVSTAGFKAITGLTLQLTAGLYQLVMVTNIACTVRAYAAAQAIAIGGLDAQGYNNLSNVALGRICNFSYATLPSNPPQATGNYTASAPCIVLRLS